MKLIENIDRVRFQEFALNHEKSHFLSCYGWGEFCKNAKGQIPKYIGMETDDGKLVATVLILLRKTPFGVSYGYAPRGVTIDYSNKKYLKEFTNLIKDYMKKNKIIYIKFDPDIKYQDIDTNGKKIENGNNNYELYNYLLSLGYIHKGFYRLYEGNQPRYTFRINLKKKWEDIEKIFDKSFTKSVKRSFTYDLKIDNEFNVKDFYRLTKVNSEKDGFNPKTEEYYKIFTDALKIDGNVKYFNVSVNKTYNINRINSELNKLNIELKNKTKKNYEMDRKLTEAFNIVVSVKNDYKELNTKDINEDIKKINALNETLTSCKNYYNKYTEELNKVIRKIPTNIVAKINGYKVKPYFDGKDMQDAVIDDFKL